MEDNKVDYRVYESAMARMMLINKRLFTLCIVMFAALFISNVCWVWFESRYEDTVITADQDGSGLNIIGGEDINYGAEGDN